MEHRIEKTNGIIRFAVFIIMILIACLGCGIEQVKADETEEPLTVKTSIEHTSFITFCKQENPTKGKVILACHYIPDEYYSDSFVYGVVIFPKAYMEKYEVYDDFLTQFEERNITHLNVIGAGKYDVADGKLFRCGLSGILPANENLNFTFVFYGRDNQTGEIYYTEPQFCTCATTIAKDYSVAEITVMINNKLQMNLNFKTIVLLLNELVDSVWKYLILGGVAVVGVWGAYIGIRLVVAKKKEEKIDSREMVKSLIIGIIVIFIVAVAGPLLIKGLSSWTGISTTW